MKRTVVLLIVRELVSGEDLNVQLVRVVGQEVLGGVKVGHGSTAADESDAVDLVVGQDVSDDLLREVKVDLVHLTHSFRIFAASHCRTLAGLPWLGPSRRPVEDATKGLSL